MAAGAVPNPPWATNSWAATAWEEDVWGESGSGGGGVGAGTSGDIAIRKQRIWATHRYR